MCNHFHADDVVGADALAQWLAAIVFEQLIQPFAAKIMIVLKFAPVRIGILTVQNFQATASALGMDKNSIPSLFQQCMYRLQSFNRIRHVLQYISHADNTKPVWHGKSVYIDAIRIYPGFSQCVY